MFCFKKIGTLLENEDAVKRKIKKTIELNLHNAQTNTPFNSLEIAIHSQSFEQNYIIESAVYIREDTLTVVSKAMRPVGSLVSQKGLITFFLTRPGALVLVLAATGALADALTYPG